MRGEANGPSELPSRAEERACVLVVDDDADVVQTVSSILRQEQYEVDVATSAEEGLRAVAQRPYDVMLIELALAEADGLTLLDEVRRLASATTCIVLTGYASLESAIAALRRGAYDYLVKPCEIDDLKQTVHRAIEQRRLGLLASERERQLRELNDQLEERVQARTAELMQANQSLAEANAAKDRFLATLSHELRTPLTPLRAGIDLLRSRLSGADWKPVLDAMARNLAQEARLIDDLLDIARITAGKLSLEKRPVELRACVRTAVQMIEPKAADKDIRVKLDFRGALPTLLADPERLQQLIANLLDNAVKFTPSEGRVTLTAQVANGEVSIEVVDSGPGIDPAYLARVFEPFWQADSSSRRQYGGTGLGLAISRQIAQLHGGELWAANAEPGPGARFTFRFPLVPAEIDRPSPETTRPPLHLRVLLVDDSLDTIQVLGSLLTAKGMNVREFTSVSEALRAAAVDSPDVIVTDIGMPELDGYDLLRLLHEDERLRQIPVVAATGYVGSHEQEQMAEAGFAATLSKPFDLAELLTTLERVCSGSVASETEC